MQIQVVTGEIGEKSCGVMRSVDAMQMDAVRAGLQHHVRDPLVTHQSQVALQLRRFAGRTDRRCAVGTDDHLGRGQQARCRLPVGGGEDGMQHV